MWITIGATILVPLLIFVFKWWNTRSGREQGRDEVIRANMEGEIDAQAKANEADDLINTRPGFRGRMRLTLKRKR